MANSRLGRMRENMSACGGIPFVQDHFEVIVLGIVAVSVAPAFIGAVKAAMSSKKGDKTKNAKHAK